MKITIMFSENLHNLEVGDDIELENFLALVRLEIEGLDEVEKNSNLIFVNGQQKIPVIPSNMKRPLTVSVILLFILSLDSQKLIKSF